MPINNLNKKICWQKIFLIFILSIIFFGFFQAQPYIADNDAFYHAKMAVLMKEQLIIDNFSWMQISTLKNNFADHHFLYHLILIPFTWLFTPLVAVKIAAVLLTSLAITAIYWFLSVQKLNYKWLAIFLLITTPVFLLRYSLIKANSLSLIILLLIIYALFKNKSWLLFCLSFIYVWAYGGWVLSLAAVLIHIAAKIIHRKIQKNKITLRWIFSKTNIKNLGAVISGLACGLIVNPYFPQNIKFYWQQIFQISLVNYQKIIDVGQEWQAINFFETGPLIFSPIFLFFMAAIASLIVFYKKLNSKQIFLLLFGLVFLIFSFKSKRYLEYFYPFAALIICQAASLFDSQKIKSAARQTYQKNKFAFVGLILALIIIFAQPLCHGYFQLQNHKLNKFQAASEFLTENTPKNSLVFHSRWDEWPMLFYYNANNNYLAGLDPTFAYFYNPLLYQKWLSMAKNEFDGNYYLSIKQEFQADYAFIDFVKYPKFFEHLNANEKFIKIYQDDEAAIFQLK